MAWLVAPRGERFTERKRGSAHQGNAANPVRSTENVSKKGGHTGGRPFLFCPHLTEELESGRKHADQAAEKRIYFVIPSEARNLSFFDLRPRKKKERFLASLGMTKVWALCASPGAESNGFVILRRKSWPPRLVRARDKWIRSRRSGRQSQALREILRREYRRRLPESRRALF